MNKQDLVAGILKRIGNRDYDTRTFNNRLLVQKIIFIFQEVFDVDLGYNFTLYMRGPYSTSLTKDFYKIRDTTKYEEIEFGDEGKEILLKELIEIIQEHSSDIDILELVSTIIFVNNKLNIRDDLEQVIRKLKHGFEGEQYNLSLEIANQLTNIQRRREN